MASPLADLSPSTGAALRWAWAAAAIRSRTPQSPEPPLPPLTEVSIAPEDVLIGVLLAHPDKRGEGRVLLQHFGLTARDVLPEGYPKIDQGRCKVVM